MSCGLFQIQNTQVCKKKQCVAITPSSSCFPIHYTSTPDSTISIDCNDLTNNSLLQIRIDTTTLNAYYNCLKFNECYVITVNVNSTTITLNCELSGFDFFNNLVSFTVLNGCQNIQPTQNFSFTINNSGCVTILPDFTLNNITGLNTNPDKNFNIFVTCNGIGIVNIAYTNHQFSNTYMYYFLMLNINNCYRFEITDGLSSTTLGYKGKLVILSNLGLAFINIVPDSMCQSLTDTNNAKIKIFTTPVTC